MGKSMQSKVLTETQEDMLQGEQREKPWARNFSVYSRFYRQTRLIRRFSPEDKLNSKRHLAPQMR